MPTVTAAPQRKAPLKRDDNTFILRDAFYPTIEAALKNKTNVDAFLKYVASYRNRNIEILSTIYPHRMLIFDRNGEDANIVFRTCNIDKTKVMPVIKEARKAILLDQIKADENAEVCTILIMMMKYFYKDKKILHSIYMYYAYSIWHLVYKKFYPKYLPSEELVNYTINDLNNKFTAKKLGSMDLALEEVMALALTWAEDRLERLSDKDIIDIIQGIRTRINNLNRNIGNKIHENMKAGNRLFISSETNKETGELIADRESDSGTSAVLATEYTAKFISSGVSNRNCERLAKMYEISKKELMTAVQLVHDSGDPADVKKFYDCLFYSFFAYYPNYTKKDVKTFRFIEAGDAIYKKGNSNDRNVHIIKDLTHKWLEKGSLTYRVSNSAATKNSFRKAIYMYFVVAVVDNR